MDVFEAVASLYADESAPINRWRAPLEDFASFEGFES